MERKVTGVALEVSQIFGARPHARRAFGTIGIAAERGVDAPAGQLQFVVVGGIDAAKARLSFEGDGVVTQRQQFAKGRQSCWAGTDDGDPLLHR